MRRSIAWGQHFTRDEAMARRVVRGDTELTARVDLLNSRQRRRALAAIRKRRQKKAAL